MEQHPDRPDHSERGATSFRPPGLWIPSGVLWASVFVLAGLVLFRIGDDGGSGRHGFGHAAYAGSFPSAAMLDMATNDGDYAMMTASGGNTELLYVIDSRSETFYVYAIENGERFELLERRSLPELFTVMRARSR